MTTNLVPVSSIQALADTAVLSMPSAQTRRNYTRELKRFLLAGRTLTREGLQAHVLYLRESGAGPVTIKQAMAAIRLLAREAHARGLLDDVEMYSLSTVRGDRQKGTRLGNWLELSGLRELIRAASEGPNGVRNAAIIACLAGCGLRREEVAGLTWDQWVQRSGRPVWMNVRGKGDKLRTVPCPTWAARLIERWKLQEQEQNV